MPGFHIPDGQAKVNMKSLEQSLARYLSLKRYAIDYKETKLQRVSYTGLWAYKRNPQYYLHDWIIQEFQYPALGGRQRIIDGPFFKEAELQSSL